MLQPNSPTPDLPFRENIIRSLCRSPGWRFLCPADVLAADECWPDRAQSPTGKLFHPCSIPCPSVCEGHGSMALATSQPLVKSPRLAPFGARQEPGLGRLR
jgi:hypothetical protein